MLRLVAVLTALVAVAQAGPTLYKVEGEMAEEVKIPVSSTGIISLRYYYIRPYKQTNIGSG